MNYYLFATKTPEEAEKELAGFGLKDIYQIEDAETGEILIGGRMSKPPKLLRFAKLIEKSGPDVDWEEQWSLFAANFFEGKAHIDLKAFGKNKTLLLAPGPGFGDLSHPTTALMLEMMKGRVKRESILDIGSGSGILTLAALLLGAASAAGLDIDPKALKHAKLNAKLNHLNARFTKALPKNLPSSNICLINMIFPEQKIALRRVKRYNRLAKLWIVSGILAEQKQEYLDWAKSHGWKLERMQKKNGWLGFIFKNEECL